MTAEPKSPFPRRVDRTLLGRLSKPMGSPGQCLAVYRLLDHPGWLFKQYRPEQLRQADELRLSRLIALPDKLTAADRRLLLGHTCWPQTQVLDGRVTIGVVLPEAPSHYFARLLVPGGTRERTALLLTQLASDEDAFERVGLTPPTLPQRLAACTGLIEIGDLLERNSLIYGDWGYKNVFWSQFDHSVYFIDIDACSFGPQPWVQSHGFTDPQTPEGRQVDTYTERFRCAIAVAACLTGTRKPAQAISGLAQLSADARVVRLAPVLKQIVGCAARCDRLPIGELRKALSTSSTPSPAATARPSPAPTAPTRSNDGTNIQGWVPVPPRPAGGQNPLPRQTSSTPRRSSNAPWPGAAPPDYRSASPVSTANAFTGTATVRTRTAGSGSAATRPLSTSALRRHQKRQLRITLLVSVLLLLMAAGITSLLVAVL
ncbi:hypothetical protein KGA66_23245 [Actinocrinis puniceicyclus]|uniref:Uncharacterized protein n=1 Tax=Actinocrinis puniceicyclus TaxID=977794 RepID=A0A8J7WP62_9ACTN|nr:hypothetical protein [Actinocrinis puniceicyclus]MBS2965981.1 hypothetical protein [Actinocrinis puniceicyclus]